MFGKIPVRVRVRGCKCERYVRYISTYEQLYQITFQIHIDPPAFREAGLEHLQISREWVNYGKIRVEN